MEASLTFRVPFQDVDSMRIVWHGNYPRYFEQVRAELMRRLGFTYLDMEQAGYAFPIVTLSVKYKAPARFDELICVTARLVPCENCLDIAYEVKNAATGQLLVTAATRQMAVCLKTQESLFELPEPLLGLMRRLL